MPAKFFVVVFLAAAIAPVPATSQSQMSQTSQLPAKIEVAPVRQQNRLGDDVPVQVQLLDGNGKPVAASQNIDAELKVEQPSGQTTTTAVTFAPGESSKQVNLPIGESGVAKLTVKQRDQRLIGGSNFVLVRPPAMKNYSNRVVKQKKEKEAEKPSSGPNSRLRELPRQRGSRARLVFAAYVPQVPAPPAHSSASAAAAQLALTISGEDANGGTRANGSTCAQVQAFYLGADDLQRDLQIWLSQSNGVLDHNPIVIRKGTASGSACWTSLYPIPGATITVTATNPPNIGFAALSDGSDPKRLTHKFTDNIGGIEFVNFPQSITIADIFSLRARFKDPNGQPVKLTDKREMHFTPGSAFLSVNPTITTVDVGGFDSSTVLIPSYFGQSTVEVSTPDYPVVRSPITVTWLSVLCASLLGGLLGGLLAWVNSDGKLWARILTGLVVGMVASWAYVIVGLPIVQKAFLHNQLSVLFVALIVGFSGVKGFTVIASKLNLAGF